MRFVWICVLLVCYISRSLGATVKASQNPVGIPEDENKNAVDETEQNVEISRIKNEFNNFSEMVDKFMQEYSVQNFEGLKNLTAIDIIRKVIDRNATYTVTNFPNSCPPYRTGHGIYEVKVAGLPAFEVLCNSNIAGPGWTVIASRTVGDLNFFRSWQEYKDGFGSLTTEFFIGLDKLHAITAAQPHELYIYFEDFQGNKRHALYADFLIGTESEKYVMSKLGSYSGDVGDSLKRHANKKFTTRDNDNDESSDNCAMERMGAWWYADCTDSNLFGLYLGGKYHAKLNGKGMFWNHWLGWEYSYKVVQMMVRPKCPCSYETS